MTRWLNTVSIAMPRGTTTNVVDPATSGTVVAGSRFVPAAGRLLVLNAGGGVTQTTPAGWTLPTGGSAVASGGLYVWWRAAAGADVITTTLNAAWPTIYTFTEYAAGSAFLASAAATGVAKAAGAGPTLAMAAGTKVVVAAGNQDFASTTGSASWGTWGSSAVEFVDTFTLGITGSDGYASGLAYIEDSTATSLSVATTLTSTSGNTVERLLYAVTAAAAPLPNPDLNMAARRR